MKVLGRAPSISVWLRGGALQEAKRTVHQWVRTGTRPAYRLEYLAPPAPECVRAKVVARGDGQEITHPFPGGVEFDSLLDAAKRGDYAFLANEESVWKIDLITTETSPSGDAYISVTLLRVREKSQDDRQARIKEELELIRKGAFAAKMLPHRREDLYERGAPRH